MPSRRQFLALSGVAVLAASTRASVAQAVTSNPKGTKVTTPPGVTASPATLISQVAGVADGWPCLRPNSTNGVKGMNFNSGDLGIMWDRGDGNVNVVFGDNYGDPWKAPVTIGPAAGAGGGNTSTWRANSLLVSDSVGPAGLTIVDNANAAGSAQCEQLIAPLKALPSCVPTAAISLFGTQYMAVMDVSNWSTGGDDMWATKQSCICVSSNNGQDWDRSAMVWPNSGGGANFQQLAFAQQGSYLYVFGTPNGRHGNAYLARVPLASSPLIPASYQYWTGPTSWSNSSAAAVPVITAPVAELSVRYDATLNLWMATFMDGAGDIVLLTSASPTTAVWQTQTLLQKANYAVYGGFQHPWSTSTDLYFTGSNWDTYQTYLFHSSLVSA